MVVLNDFLPINISSLKIHISNKIRDILDDKLDYFIESSTIIKKNDKDSIFDSIIKEVKNTISSDYFLYLIMHDNYCVHKYKKGEKEGHYCAKKIRSNNPKKVYLCCQHDKNHIPQKKQIKNCNNINNTQIVKSENISNSTKTIEKIDINNNSKEISKNKNGKLDNLLKLEEKVNNMSKKAKYNKIYEKHNDQNKSDKIFNDSAINNIETNKLNKINKFNKYKKHKHKWKKLDIVRDTGFVFG